MDKTHKFWPKICFKNFKNQKTCQYVSRNFNQCYSIKVTTVLFTIKVAKNLKLSTALSTMVT